MRRLLRSARAEPEPEPEPAAAEPEADADVEQCTVCLEPLSDAAVGDAAVVSLACSHKFHAGCAVRWLQVGRGRCPSCRHQPDDEYDDVSSEYHDDEGESVDEDEQAHQAWHANVRATAIANEVAMRQAVGRALAKARGKRTSRELTKSAKSYRRVADKHGDLKRSASAARAKAVAGEREKRRKDDKEYTGYFRKIRQFKEKERKVLDKALKASAEKLAPLRVAEARAERALQTGARSKWAASETLAAHVGWVKYVSPPCPWSSSA